MVDRQAADHAPRDFTAFQRFDEQRNVAAAARCLPVVKLPYGHAWILSEGMLWASCN